MQFEADIVIFLQSALKNYIWFFKIITQLGSVIGVLIFGIIFFIKDKKYSVFYILLSGVCAGLNFLVKFFTNRQRPYIIYPQIYNYLSALGSSMPSSHTIIITLAVIFLIYFTNKYFKKNLPYVIVTGIALEVFVIISRMVLGQHYLTDCLVGLIVGVIISVLSLLVYNRKIKFINFKK